VEESLKKLCLVACLLSALVLAACGGDSGEDVAQIEAVIRAAKVDADPAQCSELRTQNYLEQEAQEAAKPALESCEEGVGDNPAHSVTISEVEVEGDSATAEVAADGGSFDGQVVEFALAEKKGRWKLDEVTRFVEFDADAFARATEETLSRRNVALGVADCVGEKFEQVSREEVEAMVLALRPTEELVELAQSCEPQLPEPGERYLPDGAQYSYVVPAGFGLAKPQTAFQPGTAVSGVSPLDGTGDGPGVVLGQIPLNPIRTRAQILRFLPEIEKQVEESAALVGTTPSPTKLIEIDGYPAIQWESEGPTVGPQPGTELRETTIFSEPERVVVVCRWRGSGEERDLILEGCDSVLRSLRVSN
jgi:hypothetical protein